MARFHTNTQTDISAFAPKVRDWLISSRDNPIGHYPVMVLRGATSHDARRVIAPELWYATPIADVPTDHIEAAMSHPLLEECDQVYLRKVYAERTA